MPTQYRCRGYWNALHNTGESQPLHYTGEPCLKSSGACGRRGKSGGGGRGGGGGEVMWLWRRRRRRGSVVVEKQVY